MMRVKVTVTYEMDIEPDYYPEEMQSNPSAMVEFDLNVDAAAILMEGDNLTVSAEEVKT